jgi:hypothetical protein
LNGWQVSTIKQFVSTPPVTSESGGAVQRDHPHAGHQRDQPPMDAAEPGARDFLLLLFAF